MSFNATRAVFNSADLNRDGQIDRSEFGQFVGNNAGGYGAGGSASYETAYSSGSYGAGLGGAAGYGASLGGAGGYGAGLGGAAGYGASLGGAAGYGASLGGAAGYGASDASASYAAGAGLGGASSYGAGGAAAYDASSFGSAGYGATAVQTYATDAQGLFQDPNPQIIRRPAPAGAQTYTQNIRVRFLQPPPVPPHGPLIIQEVRPPQPPAPAPLRIRQQAPPLPTPPPLVLRERPPQPPGVIGSQTVIRRLAGLPVPPRSVIVERFPPLPPRPRDVIIERWIPYGAQAKRRVIVQRAAAAQQYAAPRNVIIQYEQSPARIARQFQRLGVTAASPAAYVQQYGGSLLESSSLVQAARSAGVVEDISAPGVVASVGYGAATYGVNAAALGGGYSYGGGLGATSSSESNSYGGSSGYGVSGYGASGYGASGYGASGYGASGYGASGYGASGYGASGYGASGLDVAGSAFNYVDANDDGSIDQSEFNQFFQQGL